ncbi:MAG TPA: hypothetical protein VGV41_18305 [Pseudolabrys sp.]|uniref:hypothetical protein n=1 Tax=Pseudolabrys sp. TaxID=1960880 RepID=UPI002DDCF6D4|nr:hypothetical protein [Pseudolabrys sp.]HEV2630579.1 hypothetical protein [Pseudolabrys sp.]
MDIQIGNYHVLGRAAHLPYRRAMVAAALLDDRAPLGFGLGGLVYAATVVDNPAKAGR